MNCRNGHTRSRRVCSFAGAQDPYDNCPVAQVPRPGLRPQDYVAQVPRVRKVATLTVARDIGSTSTCAGPGLGDEPGSVPGVKGRKVGGTDPPPAREASGL